MTTVLIFNLFQSNDVKKGDSQDVSECLGRGRRNLCLDFLEYLSERINVGYVGIDGRIKLKWILQKRMSILEEKWTRKI
jgi:hypothetical protein